MLRVNGNKLSNKNPKSKYKKLLLFDFLLIVCVASIVFSIVFGALGMFAPGVLPFTFPVAPFYFFAGGIFLFLFFIILKRPISKTAKVLLVLALVFGTAATAGALGMFAPGVLPFTLPVAPFYFLAGGALLAVFFTIFALPISTKAKVSLVGFLVFGTAAAAGALGMFAPGILPFTLPVAPFYFLAGGALLAVFFTILALPISTKAKLSLGFALIGAGAAGLGALGVFAPGILPFTLGFLGSFLVVVLLISSFLIAYKIMHAVKDNDKKVDLTHQGDSEHENGSAMTPASSAGFRAEGHKERISDNHDNSTDVNGKSNQPDNGESKADEIMHAVNDSDKKVDLTHQGDSEHENGSAMTPASSAGFRAEGLKETISDNHDNSTDANGKSNQPDNGESKADSRDDDNSSFESTDDGYDRGCTIS